MSKRLVLGVAIASCLALAVRPHPPARLAGDWDVYIALSATPKYGFEGWRRMGFAHFAGSEAKVTMAVGLQVASPQGTSERKNFRGILRGVEGDSAKIEVDGQVFALPIADIDHAKLVPDWDAVMHGKSGAGTKTAEPTNPKKKSKKSSHASN
jgi:hypothetical protein